MTYQMTLDTVQTLIAGLPDARAHERRELYSAVQVLLVQLVERLERRGCENDELYERCGELLDHCSYLAGLRQRPSGPERLQLASLTMNRLRSGLVVQSLAC